MSKKWCVRAKTMVVSCYLSHSLKEERIHFKRSFCWQKFRKKKMYSCESKGVTSESCYVSFLPVDSKWMRRGEGEGARGHLSHWGDLFFCIFQGFRASLKHSLCRRLPCLSLGRRGKGNAKKILWMVNRRGTWAALASCHCLLCQRCQSHHIRLPPQGACKWERERGRRCRAATTCTSQIVGRYMAVDWNRIITGDRVGKYSVRERHSIAREYDRWTIKKRIGEEGGGSTPIKHQKAGNSHLPFCFLWNKKGWPMKSDVSGFGIIDLSEDRKE